MESMKQGGRQLASAQCLCWATTRTRRITNTEEQGT